MQVKSGWKTSEFWLACGTAITAFVVSLMGDDPTAKASAGGVAAVAILGYLYSRHELKIAAGKAAAEKKD